MEFQTEQELRDHYKSVKQRIADSVYKPPPATYDPAD